MRALDAAAVIAVASLLAVWLGYPLTIALLARLRRRPRAAGGELPSVTVVLATRGSREEIADRVADLLAADYPAELLDVVIARDLAAPSLEADAFAELGRRVSLVAGDAPGGKASTLNAGVRSARGDVVLFADTHQRFRRDAVRRLAGALAGPYAAVSGRWAVPEGKGGATESLSVYWRLEARLRADEARLHSTIGVTGAIYAMRRSLWTPLPAGLLLDDVYAPMRLVLAGHRVGYETDAVATDLRAIATGEDFHRKVRTLSGILQLVAWLPAVVVPFRNPVWIQFVFHKLLRLLSPYLVLVVGAWAALRAATILARFPLSAALVVGLAVVASLAGGKRLLQAVWRAFVWGLALQAATVVATAYGLRGRWNVWRT